MKTLGIIFVAIPIVALVFFLIYTIKDNLNHLAFVLGFLGTVSFYLGKYLIITNKN